jgi:hypothetical protein
MSTQIQYPYPYQTQTISTLFHHGEERNTGMNRPRLCPPYNTIYLVSDDSVFDRSSRLLSSIPLALLLYVRHESSSGVPIRKKTNS